MTINPGAHLGPYEIQAALGEGGMGEVYRARDTRLDRVVAIKVLPPGVAKDSLRRERFEHEARIVSSLNHPNICTLYDVGHQDDVDYLVMELLQGQTVTERLTKGTLTLEQALQYATQIASALDAAHRQGIIHRDLKPANVMLTKAGAKLLDFGIAKAMAPGSAAPATLTAVGTLLGTLHYMAPEQLEGRDADARSDLFAFGAVLYEMVTGRQAFSGESQAGVIAAVLEGHPPAMHVIHVSVPPALEHLIATCLAKNPDDRWQSATDLKRQLEWIAAEARSTITSAPRSSHRSSTWQAVATATGVALVASVAAAWYAWPDRRQVVQPLVTHTTIVTTREAALSPGGNRRLALTPDGTRVVYIGNQGKQIFLRPLDRVEATVIFTSGVSPLNWVAVSPDGKWVGFQEGVSLRKVDLNGGPVETLVESANRGVTWASNDTIIFASSDPTTGLQRVSADGGVVTVLTRPDPARGELAHLWPEMLPDGQAVLFTITATTGGFDAAQVAVLDLMTGVRKVLVRGGRHARYVPGMSTRGDGHLVYVKGTALMAVAFNPATLEARGTAVAVVPHIATRPAGSADFDVASDGTLAYVNMPDGSAEAARTLVWADRQGRVEPLPVSLPGQRSSQPRVSPDGNLIAVVVDGGDVWLVDVVRKKPRQLTSSPLQEFFPLWTKDGRHVVFSRPVAGLFWQRADSTGMAEPLGVVGLASGLAPDGQVLFSPGAKDVKMLDLDTRKVTTLLQTPATERNAVVSPNGRWLAYESDTSLKPEIYVTSFLEGNRGPSKISTGGGTRPLWSRNGQELFYVAPDGAIMAVRDDSRGGLWSASSPAKILSGGLYDAGGSESGRNYDISPDGQRFLMVKDPPADSSAGPQIELVQHWDEELNRLVPLTR